MGRRMKVRSRTKARRRKRTRRSASRSDRARPGEAVRPKPDPQGLSGPGVPLSCRSGFSLTPEVGLKPTYPYAQVGLQPDPQEGNHDGRYVRPDPRAARGRLPALARAMARLPGVL